MNDNMSNMEEEYSIAVFEDGTKEMIPKSWIQDYLKEESSEKESDTEMEQEQSTQQQVPPSASTRYSLVLDSQYCETTKKILQTIVKEVGENRSAILKLQKSIDRLLCVATGEPEPEIDLSQPAENINEFLAIEEYIKMKQNYNDLMCNLSKIGGKTVESTTRKIWSRLCTTRLASTICWTGANGKYCLKSLTLNRLVREINMPFSFDRNATNALISLYEQHTNLYMVSTSVYRNKNGRLESFKNIEDELNRCGIDNTSWWKRIRDSEGHNVVVFSCSRSLAC